MSDLALPLGGAVHKRTVTIEEAAPQGMLTIRGRLDDAAITGAVATATGLSVPDQRQVTIDGARRLAWMSPDELLLILPRADLSATSTALTEALGTAHSLVADMSDARCLFRLSGPDAALRDTLARLAPVDMSRVMPGEIRRTRLAQVAAAIWMPAPGQLELISFRSTAQYTYDLLVNAATGPALS
ncbi:sarcosine oxidase subunit gamma [Pseudooceanicola sp. C21-150M6]|uniref:sarcosine oxidase subunit gamma n=1 Tax=Pseudooceanicola sp. C21-150M6 TaxID=3434355 RepID=UPI003D7F9EC4